MRPGSADILLSRASLFFSLLFSYGRTFLVRSCQQSRLCEVQRRNLFLVGMGIPSCHRQSESPDTMETTEGIRRRSLIRPGSLIPISLAVVGSIRFSIGVRSIIFGLAGGPAQSAFRHRCQSLSTA